MVKLQLCLKNILQRQQEKLQEMLLQEISSKNIFHLLSLKKLLNLMVIVLSMLLSYIQLLDKKQLFLIKIRLLALSQSELWKQ